MLKKTICIVALVMMIFSFVACDVFDLAAHKISAKAELDAHIAALTDEN